MPIFNSAIFACGRHPDLAIARQGGWNHDALAKHYLAVAPIRTMLGLAGVTDAPQTDLQIAYWAPHLVPYVDDMEWEGEKVDLRLKAFPFLGRLRAAVAQVIFLSQFFFTESKIVRMLPVSCSS